MKAILNVTNSLSFEIQADDEVGVFKELARIQEIFSFKQCGKCKSSNIKYQCRQDKDENDWLELVCLDCRAKLVFGTTKKGKRIFPKIRSNHLSETQQKERWQEVKYAEENNGWLPNSGWYIYNKIK